jgi:TRAP-type C4-dicarboxylate transport system substrate-binding protein
VKSRQSKCLPPAYLLFHNFAGSQKWLDGGNSASAVRLCCFEKCGFLKFCSFAEVTLKYATLAPENTVWARTIKKCVDEIAEKTRRSGTDSSVFYGGIAGDEPSVMRKLRTGTIDIASFTGQTLGLVVSESRLLELPYLF